MAKEKLLNNLKTFAKDSKAATAIEYALLASLVGLGAMSSISLVGDGLRDNFRFISNSLSY